MMTLNMIVITIDLIGFFLFWYIWRTFEKKRNVDQIMGVLFSIFCIVDITWIMFPMFVPDWMLHYVPSCWLVVFTRAVLISTALMDVHRRHLKCAKKYGRRKEDKKENRNLKYFRFT